MSKIILSVLFLATIPAANWMVGHVGWDCSATSPCIVPVWPLPLMYAPSGSVIMGVALVLRNLLQQRASRRWILACIAVGALISAMVAPPALTLASVAAFSASETGDWLVYSRLRRSGLTIAILAAGVVGSIIDSGLFVTIAFGLSFWLIAGQFIAKVWSTLFAAGITLAFALKCRDIKTVTRAS